MASITIRNISDELKRRLCIWAAEHKRSMEEEGPEILRDMMIEPAPSRNLAATTRADRAVGWHGA